MTATVLRLHECSECKQPRKLPYRGDASSWCDRCERITHHTLQAEQCHVSESLNSRVERFMSTMSSRFFRDPPPEDAEPLSGEEIAAKLRSSGYPSRQVEFIGKMTGPGLRMSDKLREFRRPDSHYVLFGPNGTGKTQIAARIAGLRIGDGKPSGRYITAPDLVAAMKGAIERHTPQDEFLRPFRATGFLVIDEAQDIGSTDKSAEWVREAFRTIADARYREFRPMLWLLNANSADEVAKHLGGRIIDRVNETGGMIHCNWSSYRTPQNS